MQALKEVGRLQTILGNSALAKSPIWEMAVDSITPIHLHAFIARHSAEGSEELARSLIDQTQKEIVREVGAGRLHRVRALDYAMPSHRIVTMTLLKAGLAQMSRVRGQALLFGLEEKLPVEEVVALKWKDVRDVCPQPTRMARTILEAQPRFFKGCEYVFWNVVGNKAWPVHGLDRDVFDAFELVYAELLAGYDDLLLVDYTDQLLRWQELLPH